MRTRQAVDADLPGILRLLTDLHLPVEGVAEHLGHFLVLEADGGIAGTVGLEAYGRRALLRSLGVAKELQGRGYGDLLCERIVERAKEIGVREIFLLTETAAPFFARRGFAAISRDAVDETVKTSVEFRWFCPASAVCMRRHLT